MSTSFPNMAGAIKAWMQPLVFVEVCKSQDEQFLTVESYVPRKAFGIRVPLKPQELMFKPEGQRAWKWEQIFSTPSLVLGIDAIIEFEKRRYRVMSKTDYSQYGYVIYDICQDFTAC